MTGVFRLNPARDDLERRRYAQELLARQIDAIASMHLQLKSAALSLDPVLQAEVRSEMDEFSQQLMSAGNRLMERLIQIENEIEMAEGQREF